MRTRTLVLIGLLALPPEMSAQGVRLPRPGQKTPEQPTTPPPLTSQPAGSNNPAASGPSGATLKIVSPTSGAAADAGTVKVSVDYSGPALVPETKVGSTVLVTLNDNLITIENPDDIPPGPAILTVKNIGTQVHNLFIEGPGVNKAAGDSFPPGKVADVDVTFAPGTYTLYCPILDHRQKGEELKLVIKPPKAPAPSSITG